ncbi:MAG: hypothetical protein LBT73_00475 [Tannerellaceae bacterium]|jgi:hypothetical protein|nr:hypothetical protein [Tannerellaceae bacterium]
MIGAQYKELGGVCIKTGQQVFMGYCVAGLGLLLTGSIEWGTFWVLETTGVSMTGGLLVIGLYCTKKGVYKSGEGTCYEGAGVAKRKK